MIQPQQCIGSLCAADPATCPADCNAQRELGRCTAYSANNVAIAGNYCAIADSFCSVKCECIDGYSGADCSLDSRTVAWIAGSRTQLCQSVKNLSRMQDVTEQYLAFAFNSVVSVLKDPTQVTDAGIKVCIEVVEDSVMASPYIAADDALFGVVIDAISLALDRDPDSLPLVLRLLAELSKARVRMTSLSEPTHAAAGKLRFATTRTPLPLTLSPGSTRTLSQSEVLSIRGSSVEQIFGVAQSRVMLSCLMDVESDSEVEVVDSSFEVAAALIEFHKNTHRITRNIASFSASSTVPPLDTTTSTSTYLLLYNPTSVTYRNIAARVKLSVTVQMPHTRTDLHSAEAQSSAAEGGVVLCEKLRQDSYIVPVSCNRSVTTRRGILVTEQKNFSVECPAEKPGKIRYTCPSQRIVPTLVGSSVSEGSCKLVSYNTTESTAHCAIAVSDFEALEYLEFRTALVLSVSNFSYDFTPTFLVFGGHNKTTGNNSTKGIEPPNVTIFISLSTIFAVALVFMTVACVHDASSWVRLRQLRMQSLHRSAAGASSCPPDKGDGQKYKLEQARGKGREGDADESTVGPGGQEAPGVEFIRSNSLAVVSGSSTSTAKKSASTAISTSPSSHMGYFAALFPLITDFSPWYKKFWRALQSEHKYLRVLLRVFKLCSVSPSPFRSAPSCICPFTEECSNNRISAVVLAAIARLLLHVCSVTCAVWYFFQEGRNDCTAQISELACINLLSFFPINGTAAFLPENLAPNLRADSLCSWEKTTSQCSLYTLHASISIPNPTPLVLLALFLLLVTLPLNCLFELFVIRLINYASISEKYEGKLELATGSYLNAGACGYESETHADREVGLRDIFNSVSRKPTKLLKEKARLSLQSKFIDNVSVAEELCHVLSCKSPSSSWSEQFKEATANSSKIMNILTDIRARADKLHTALLEVETSAEKNKRLLRCYVIDRLTGFRRILAERCFRPFSAYESHSSSKESSNIRTSAWALGMSLVVVYLGALSCITGFLGLRIQNESTNLWASSVVLIFALDVLALQPFVIWVDYLVLPTHFSTELLSALAVLRDSARVAVRRSAGLLRVKDVEIQHCNAACRAARRSPQLLAARLLVALQDCDIRPHRKIPISSCAQSFLAINTLGVQILCLTVFKLPIAIQDLALEVMLYLLLCVLYCVCLYATLILQSFSASKVSLVVLILSVSIASYLLITVHSLMQKKKPG